MVLIQDNSRVLTIGDPMPHFQLPDALGGDVDSTKIRSKVLAIIFTCNHCPYAKANEDRLIHMAREFADTDVSFVLISSNDATNYPDDSFDAMKARAQEKEYPFSYCYDESQDVAKAFGALCTPHCFVFDDDRKLQYKGRVDDNWKEPEKITKHDLQDAIEALTQNEEPPLAEANAIGCSIKWKLGNEPPTVKYT